MCKLALCVFSRGLVARPGRRPSFPLDSLLVLIPFPLPQLDSGEEEERAVCCESIASLLAMEGPEAGANRERMLSAGLTRRLVARVLDPAPAVALQAVGALRSVLHVLMRVTVSGVRFVRLAMPE